MTNNYRWLDPRGLLHGSWPARAGRLLLILLTLLLIGFPLHNPDVFRYPSHLESYIEEYAEFILDPFGDNFFLTQVEITGGRWKRSFRIEEFDGKYWLFKEDIEKSGEGLNIVDPELPAGLASDTGEAVVGQRSIRNRTESNELIIKDLGSGKEYIISDYIGFFRISDRENTLKPINEANYRTILTLKGSWKAELLAAEKLFGNHLISFRLFVPDELFEQVNRWPD